ncbi:YdeI/OmpD-associated family protein [Pedobacter sp. BG31]|uniref:YdeI/OmpD-associated family protein n=1 Tax=Pedobacter sp. BG31 TaxID=3349697 RepID=UPI0035F31018
MDVKKPKPFAAEIKIIGINPFVFVPEEVLNYVFHQSGKNKGKLPVKMKIDGHEFKQTLVKYAGDWRLYLNMPMRKAAGKGIGDTATFEIEFDPKERIIDMHPKLIEALAKHQEAKEVFDGLSPYLQKEIVGYIENLKTEASVDKNVKRAIVFLLGEERFIGRPPLM